MNPFKNYREFHFIKDKISNKKIIVGEYSYYAGFYHRENFEDRVRYLDKEDVTAVLWDFDGTIADTMKKHFLINQKMYSLIKPKIKKENWPTALESLEKYINAEYSSINWKDLYKKHLGFSEKQIKKAQNFWEKLVSQIKTPVKIFDGLHDVLKKIKLPHGICSQNCSKNIKKILQEHKIDHHFKYIVGNKDILNQKPHPQGFLYCIEKMKIKDGILFYIGDHEEDVIFARNAEIALKEKGHNFKIFSILACYNGFDISFWNIKPDFKAHSPKDIAEIILEKRTFIK